VGPTYKPCTRGIWIWASPIVRTALDGTTYNLVRKEQHQLSIAALELNNLHCAGPAGYGGH
jgi:hypothetical protein